MDTTDDPRRATGIAGSLRLTVRYDGDLFGSGGIQRRYRYEITDWDGLADRSFQGTDLESGVGERVDARRALRSLVSFLTAAADAYRSAMSRPGSHPEAFDLFPGWVAESAYINDDELAALRLDLETSSATARPRRVPNQPAPDSAHRHPPTPSGPSL